MGACGGAVGPASGAPLDGRGDERITARDGSYVARAVLRALGAFRDRRRGFGQGW
jgi:hypothetical protein